MKDSLKKLMGRPAPSNRRGFLKTFSAAAAATFWADEQLEAYQQNVNTNSKASDLKITDMRVATVVGAPDAMSHHSHRHKPRCLWTR